AQCANNLRQLAIAAHNYESARGYFPSGSVFKEYPGDPNAPWSLFRWSALAVMTPYLENTAVYNALDLTAPLYLSSLSVNPKNAAPDKIWVSEFICPSDEAKILSPDFAPTSYAACAGSGTGGGSPTDADGICYANSQT